MGEVKKKVHGLRLRGETYYADTSVKGKKIFKKIGKVSLTEAKIALNQILSNASNASDTPDAKNINNVINPKILTIHDILVGYSNAEVKDLVSFKSRQFYFKALDRLLGNEIIENLRISKIREYQKTRQSEKRKIGHTITENFVNIPYINSEVKELIRAIKWAIKERLIDFNPINGIDKLKENRPKKIMLDEGQENGEQWRKLFNALGEKNRYSGKLTLRGRKTKLKYLIQYKTGMRIGEVNALEHNWINETTMRIYLPEYATKSRKERIIPIDRELIEAINKFKIDIKDTKYNHHKYLFFNKNTNNHDKMSFDTFKNAIKRAGLPDGITSHALRRTRGTIWDVIDERASMEALGHSDFQIHRKHYTNVTSDRFDKLIKNFDNSLDSKSNLILKETVI
jgi:integrase